VPPAVALLNYISCGILWRIFCQTGTFRGVFSIHISLISQDTPPYFYIIDGMISEAAMCGAEVGGHYISWHRSSRDFSIPRVPECMPHRRNWLPSPPPLKVSVSPPLDLKGGGATFSLQVRGWGTHLGRLDRRPDTLYTLWTRGIVERNAGGPSSVNYFYFWSMNKKQQSCDGRGARSVPFCVSMSPKRLGRAAHGRARAAKTH
jgi:hypothetical protein